MKVDSNGLVEWSKTFGGSDVDSGKYVLQAADGGYIVFGETASYGTGDYDGWVVKFSSFENQRSNKPNRSTGPLSGEIGIEYTYTSSTIDPDGDDIYYIFDWGDGTDSGWLGPYNSGEICEDVNNDGIIKVLDLVLVANHYDETWWI